jgi:lysophospholipase L1-like esterase
MRDTSRILCLGDSLTAGILGISWLEILRDRPALRSCELINAGENGFTMAGLASRLTAYLEKEDVPDILVLEGGANDILLPHMQSAGRAWDPFIRKLRRHGSRPAASLPDFSRTLAGIYETAERAGIGKVVCCTIPCLGEDLESPLNRRREEYNRILRESSDLVADAAAAFEAVLRPLPPSSYLFQTPEELQEDAQTLSNRGEEPLCGSRGLHLTIDGAHLNGRGARIFAETVAKSLFL